MVISKSSVPGIKQTQLRCRSDCIHKYKINIDDTSIPRRARLKFPHIADNKKWKHLDEVVSKSVKPIINKLKSNDINTTTLSFEQTVYDTLAEHLEVTKPRRKQFQNKNSDRLLMRLRKTKSVARKTWRAAVRNKNGIKDAYKLMMKAVKAHSSLLHDIQKK